MFLIKITKPYQVTKGMSFDFVPYMTNHYTYTSTMQDITIELWKYSKRNGKAQIYNRRSKHANKPSDWDWLNYEASKWIARLY